MAVEVEHAERIAVLETQVRTLLDQSKETNEIVKRLEAQFQQAKGARWVLVGLAGVGGFFAGKGPIIAAWLGLAKG